ncbi:hypothetical protein LUZ60_012446 [Juncus effusus]|nr:hypothetical protein LUZ60_012446 [Juncus effusus]
MRCNACWRELESQAISTTCGHIFCKEDANKILNSDGPCPVCDQVLSKSLMKAVEINPGEEWINMSMAGISTQILMKSAYRSVMFEIGQKELEMEYKMNRLVAQYRQKFEGMQAKFQEKMEEVQSAYQKMGKKCQLMEKEIESLSKDKQELQDKYAEKSRQKRKLDEMYDQLRTEYEFSKRTAAIQPSKGIFGRNDPDLFHTQDGRNNLIPETPGRKEDAFRAHNNSLDLSIGSPIPTTGFRPVMGNNSSPVPTGFRPGNNPVHTGFRPGLGNGSNNNPNRFRGAGNNPGVFGSGSRNSPVDNGFGSGSRNPSETLRNLVFSPMNRTNQNRARNNMFQL